MLRSTPILLLLLPLVAAGCGDDGSSTPSGEGEGEGEGGDAVGLLFSEYVEGSGENKAMEIHNPGTLPTALTGCSVQLFANGASEPSQTIELEGGPISAGGVFVLCHSGLDEAGRGACDQLSGDLGHNGNDALALVCDGETLDVFGQIGVDPGKSWGAAELATEDHTLRRLCTIRQGDRDGSDPFDTAAEWNAFAKDALDGLGSHCP